jgi:LPS sulfotransferase NodH
MSTRPTSAYLVCATPRSGSTLLCETLRATGVAGRPAEHFEILRHSGLPRQPREYFEDVRDPGVLERLAPLRSGTPDAEAAAAWRNRILRAGTTENGVWGGKLMWGHVSDVVARARRLDGLAGADLLTVLHALLGEDVRLVFVTRRDRVAQAVSLWRALQTQSWRKDGAHAADADAEYRFAGIDHLVRQLDAHEAAWRRWFLDNGVAPLELVYEQLSDDLAGGVDRVLHALELPRTEVPPAPLRRQRDARSREWAERYRREQRVFARGRP